MYGIFFYIRNLVILLMDFNGKKVKICYIFDLKVYLKKDMNIVNEKNYLYVYLKLIFKI